MICLSPAYYGYSLTIIGACNLSVLFQSYNITIAKETALALMNGMLPIGGMIGCLLFPKLRMLTTKKYKSDNVENYTITWLSAAPFYVLSR